MTWQQAIEIDLGLSTAELWFRRYHVPLIIAWYCAGGLLAATPTSPIYDPIHGEKSPLSRQKLLYTAKPRAALV